MCSYYAEGVTHSVVMSRARCFPIAPGPMKSVTMRPRRNSVLGRTWRRSVFGHISVRILTRAPRIFGLSLRKNRTLTKDSSCRQCCQGIALDKLSLMPVGIDCPGVLLRRPANRRLRHREMLTLASRRIFTGQVAPATTLLPQAETNSPLLQTYWCRSREQEPLNQNDLVV